MKTFREFINEETMPFAQTEKGFVGIDSPAVRDNINSLIAGVTDCEFITPYIALERVAKVLANFHIFLPKQTFLDSDRGMVAIEINQFGEKVGVTDNGEVVTQASSPYYLYFEYEVDDNGTFEVFSEVVTEDELDEILSDMDEEELDEEKDSEKEEDDEDEDDEDEKDSEEVEQIKEGIQHAVIKTTAKDWDDNTKHIFKLRDAGIPAKQGAGASHHILVNKDHEDKARKILAKHIKEEKIDEAAGTHLDAPQKGKLASINKLNKEEKSDMPAWYEKEKSKSASLQAATKAKKKEQQKKTDYAIRNMKEEQIDEISKEKVGKYLDANEKSREKLASKSGLHGPNINRTSENDKAEKKLMSRVKSRDVALAKKYPQYGGAKVAATEETLDELSKATLGSYIKKASHDVATKSAQVGRYAAASRYGKEKYEKSGRKDIESYRQSKKDDDTANKSFDKSWKRRKFMDKAVDKLTKEENQKAKTPQKANFNVAKKLARQAVKAEVEKAKKAKPKNK